MTATTFPATARQRLLELLARRSFRLGTFKLASGGTSSYYVDCRLTTLAAEGGRLTGQVFLETLRQLPQPPEAVGGLTLGADPIVTAIAVLSAQAPPPINGFLVRKAEKTHGTGRLIEGETRPGQRVAIVEDVCTTAGSALQAVEAADGAGLEIAAVVCLVEREEAGGRENLHRYWRERWGRDCPFASIFQAGEIRRWLETHPAAQTS